MTALRNRKHYYQILKSIAGLFILAMLFACETDMQTISVYGEIDTLPEMTAVDIRYIRSDSGRTQAILTSPLMYRYAGDKDLIEFPDGFKVDFYGEDGKVESSLTAEYGIGYNRRKIMQAEKNVVIENFESNERLETEKLTWDQNKEIIHTNTPLKITRGEDVLYGDSLISDESFKEYEIIQASGELVPPEDENNL